MLPPKTDCGQAYGEICVTLMIGQNKHITSERNLAKNTSKAHERLGSSFQKPQK